MFNESGRGGAGSLQCLYCGAKLNAPLIFCPQCGANQIAGSPRMAPAGDAMAHAAPHGLAHRLRGYWHALPIHFGGARPTMTGGYARPEAGLRVEREEYEDSGLVHSRLPYYACSALVVIALALAAYVISHRDDKEPTPGLQVVEGTVLEPQAGSAAQTLRSPASHHAAPVAVAVPPHRAQPPVPGATAQADITRSLADDHAPADKNAEPPMRGDVARNLATARTSLDKNSLWPARRAIATALAEQPDNSQAQQMRTELVSREQERDALLGYARLCEREAKWVCVWQNAGHAVTLDTSSREAKRLLARAIAEQGAGTARQVDPPPGADD
ncbi:zinc ribbon domain-containing protein [Paraburkholderia ferrariae]|uniref:zinc ribbon domain-containing protein n=1 Tax=Paraburkholderia ferrariae TaxID=386056 RepID=UPI000482C958|nr:zinc ribbon domain-containing protein [Paraburkholderia ferrariae]